MHYWFSPAFFKQVSAVALPLLLVSTVLLLGVGLYDALVLSPVDYQQGEFVRIMYVHVPAAWMGMMIYALMAVSSAGALIWRHPMADMVAQQSAPIGAAFTLICLLTGMLWGKPMWGAWWVWDARLTSMLLLFFLYIGYMALLNALGTQEQGGRGNRPAALLAIIGAINLPIIKYSVDWWYTLHQPASVFRMEGSSIHPDMLRPLLLMWLGCISLYALVLLLRLQTGLWRQRLRRLSHS